MGKKKHKSVGKVSEAFMRKGEFMTKEELAKKKAEHADKLAFNYMIFLFSVILSLLAFLYVALCL